MYTNDEKKIAEVLREAEVVFVAGNGGSACNAEHLAMHLREEGIVAINLSESCGFSAKANDYSIGNSFVRQILKLLDRKFVLVLISSSGESDNILTVAKLAKDCERLVVAFTTPNSTLHKKADYNIDCTELNDGTLDFLVEEPYRGWDRKRLQAEIHEEQVVIQVHSLIRRIHAENNV